ncbi:hypothetical protein L6452_02724 [Arctium lappa]|uniref:Uncharacterized protein n=1 Tax=Arctium lappa TaxID=4217 RepID=A0ACB9FKC9_ARCLA|nr:hypothetical protein L6452_02724 [Arctium lappa]
MSEKSTIPINATYSNQKKPKGTKSLPKNRWPSSISRCRASAKTQHFSTNTRRKFIQQSSQSHTLGLYLAL